MSYQLQSTGPPRHPPDATRTRALLERTAANSRTAVAGAFALLAGIYAAISPWVIHFSRTNPNLTATNLILGLGVAALGFGLHLAPERMRRLSWTMVPLGMWFIVSPTSVTAAYNVTAGIVWNNSCTGGMVLLFGLIATHAPWAES
ncbi:SPW repeat protein [Streptomyces sp. bgisy031]|uniref:SPW repeat protein n=1 Tax=Streptomyces sp. bgisy031 TaxID=3413772 RepID=UPI003D717120